MNIARKVLLVLLAFTMLPALAGESRDYRLAGTMNTDSGEWLAVLELPGGEQRLLSSGDSIPGGEVLEIGANWLKLTDDDGGLTLLLEGDPSDVDYRGPDAEFVSVNASALLLNALSELKESDGDASELERDIRRLLRIPGSGQIATIDDRPVDSTTQALELLMRSLNAARPVRVEVSGVEGFDAVYLMPLPEAPDSNEE